MTATGNATDMNEPFRELAAKELDRIAGGFLIYDPRYVRQLAQQAVDTPRVYGTGVRNPFGFSILGT
jgi:glucose/arabinose dehydrogenase